MLEQVPNAGRVGLNKDSSVHELPTEFWTDVYNMRFLDGYAFPIYGESEFFATAEVVPYHVVPVTLANGEAWLYAGANKIYSTQIVSNVAVHTNLTRQTTGVDVDYTVTPNEWTSTTVSGVPILNPGNTIDPPQTWDLDLAGRFIDLPGWPGSTYCKALRGYKNFLIALNVTKSGTNYPYMVKWSHPADPGSIPTSWVTNDPTVDAGEHDLAEGFGEIVDGLQLKNSFIIYREDSIWRMDFVGGQFIFGFQKVVGMAGAMNRNCIVEFNGLHLVLTKSDIIVNDGVQPVSILDKVSRRWLFRNMDITGQLNAFVFKNSFFNEIYICYPEVGHTAPNRAVVWNYKDNTVTHRVMPSVYHGNYGPLDDETVNSWASDEDPWQIDETAWDGMGFVPPNARVLLGGVGPKLSLLDSSYSDQGAIRYAYLERSGLSLGRPDKVKLVRAIRPRITGQEGETIKISVGAQTTPYSTPVWTTVDYTIGETVEAQLLVSGRYIAVRFESGTAYKWRLDSYDIEYVYVGNW